MGTREPNPRTIVSDGLIQDLDVAIPVRDGTVLRGNIYRPESHKNQQLPVILNYSVYGKDGAVDICVFPSSAGLDPSRISKYYLFEAADPGWWCKNGYAVACVDARGSHQSEGNKSYYSKDVGIDGYDIVQWLAEQSWSIGKIALYGASAYAMVTWLVAAERPPALAAIIPVDGMTDIYREMVFKGGIPEKQFNDTYTMFWNWGKNLVEDSLYGSRKHPYFDQYWQSKIPALNKIQCPAYIICGWGDHGIHTRGTLNAWKEISSEEKYLEIHQYQKWEWAVTAESLNRQKSFLDRYMLNYSQNEVQFWPRVRYTMRERYYVGEWRSAQTFPIETTRYTQFFPTRSGGLSRIAQGEAHSRSYDAQSGEVVFDLPITGTTLEFAGHAKLRLWVEAKGADNMDLFITLRKVDRNDNQVFFPWITIIDNGPIGFGFMRVSRRELDENLSTTYQPVQAHKRDLKLNSGDIVPVDIEIQPTSCRLRAGERLQVFISGHDYGTYPSGIPVPRHTETTNQGKHVIHFGGHFDSHLLLPVIPQEPDAYSETNKTVKMAVVATRKPGDTDENLIYQYTKVHADMTREIASQVPILRNYTQVLGVPRPSFNLLETSATKSRPWDVTTILGFSTLQGLWGSFQSPDYRASAGGHSFVDESTSVGILAQSMQNVYLDPIGFERRNRDSAVQMTIFLARKGPNLDKDQLSSDTATRVTAIVEASRETGLLRYVMNRSVTPKDTDDFFAGTPFLTADWSTYIALEQFWFADMAEAKLFVGNETVKRALRSLPASFDLDGSLHFVGYESRVVEKDTGF